MSRYGEPTQISNLSLVPHPVNKPRTKKKLTQPTDTNTDGDTNTNTNTGMNADTNINSKPTPTPTPTPTLNHTNNDTDIDKHTNTDTNSHSTPSLHRPFRQAACWSRGAARLRGESRMGAEASL